MFRIFVFSIFIVFMTSCSQFNKRELPVLNPSDFDPKLVYTDLRKVNQNHRVKDFSLINQNGDSISSKDYLDKIYVVDFFFTRCPSICSIMTDNMSLIQDEFINNNQIMLLSISVTPQIDSVPVLKKYANEKGVEDAKWNLTTGSKKHKEGNNVGESYIIGLGDYTGGRLKVWHNDEDEEPEYIEPKKIVI